MFNCDLCKRAMAYSCKHIYFNNAAHFAAGFGVALLVQQYMMQNAFAPACVGWALILFSVVYHALAVRRY